MSYHVEIVADSIGPNRARITTFQLRYPRMVHAEFMTHRAISRNASSTRAIPTARMIEWIEKDPAIPVYWGKNQKGMQATEELSPEAVDAANRWWLEARDEAVNRARGLMNLGVHKQIASRILEPWAHINVVATATDWANFFALRCDRMAMPEIQVLAVKMARAYRDSRPKVRGLDDPLGHDAWHLPYVTGEERGRYGLDDLIRFSVARCARVSYLTFEGKGPDPDSDIRLHGTLLGNGHWSPFEHPARAQHRHPDGPRRSGNFLGWDQYRQQLPRGVYRDFDLARLDEFEGRDFLV
jgi:thymidylate synthase ThyX